MIAGSKPCVLWDGPVSVGGYGMVCVDGRKAYVHRLACEFFHGPPPYSRAEAMHSCDTPGCYEPSHLRWGTHADNMRDAARKGRFRRGERHFLAKLSREEVLAIRARVAAGEKQIVMHHEYGVSRAQISRICRGRRWAAGEANG